MGKRPGRLVVIVLALVLLGGLGWAALVPVEAASREAVFEFPPGTSARRLAGEPVDIFPRTIRLRLGLDDVLVMKNADEVPHLFGPTIVMPGQTFRLPFSTAATYSFECTAHPNGGLEIVVEPGPAMGWERLSWRWRELTGAA